MVVLLDLDEDRVDNPDEPPYGWQTLPRDHDRPKRRVSASIEQDGHVERPTLHSLLAASLSCYPVASSLSTHLDLNDLDSLARTSRQSHANLVQFRHQLIRQTLRCTNEPQPFAGKLADRFRESQQAWTGTGANGRTIRGNNSDRITSGRVGRCARDLVAECRRCGTVVCRNCTIKSPPVKALEGRHRRLCRTCLKAPMSYHLTPPRPATYDGHEDVSPPHGHHIDNDPFLTASQHPGARRVSTPSTARPYTPRRTSTPSTPSSLPTAHSSRSTAFTSPAFTREPCTCPKSVHLCNSCASAHRTADITYMRGWTWRTRYSTYLGGLGTGIGEGNEGVACGRGSGCLNARNVEKEIDADAAELAQLELERLEHSSSKQDGASGVEGSVIGRGWTGTSFFTQEIEGIGGVVKRKVKVWVRVGAVVKEYEDERNAGDFLAREREQGMRSWCAWCERVVPGVKDVGQGEVGVVGCEAGSSSPEMGR